MNFDIADHLPKDFNDASRVWVYQSSRLLFVSEALELEEILDRFIQSWNSHGDAVKGYANLFFGRFIIFMADETDTGVSGCSTDSSVRLIKEIEKQFNIDLFNRQLLTFILQDKVEQLPLSQLNYALQQGFITADTAYFNNTIVTKKELLKNWIIPVKDSWLKNKLPSSEISS